MAGTNVHDVLGAVRDVRFPAGEKEEVARSVRSDPASDLGHGRAQRAEQARQGGKPGLSQHLRDAPTPPVEDELDQ
ncbi:DUF2795 domain-containing protein [Streptomyces sp. NPDC051322]|uniref:DUF2795 domain-containing protein n=1 Tax=Streptomyces sp. NPDC051322 TaxID=3154645 RepID=UPI00344CA92A